MAALTTGSDCGAPEVMATEPVVVGSASSASIEAVVSGSPRDPPSSPDSLVEVSQPVMADEAGGRHDQNSTCTRTHPRAPPGDAHAAGSRAERMRAPRPPATATGILRLREDG